MSFSPDSRVVWMVLPAAPLPLTVTRLTLSMMPPTLSSSPACSRNSRRLLASAAVTVKVYLVSVVEAGSMVAIFVPSQNTSTVLVPAA